MSLALALLAVGTTGTVGGTISLSTGHYAKNAVVYLEGSERSSPMAHAVIDQRDRTFFPHVSVVTVGTRVDFPNDDTVFHNVFTEFHSARFDLGMYARGKTKSQKFDRTGLAVLLCSIHPDMSAYVMVVDTPYFAVADSLGHFTMRNVPAGKYSVHVWHESGEKLVKAETVEPGSTLELRTLR